ncbi:MAG: hypothetical protein IJ001_00855 [Oscillospiraceae bacterium]|nr:hypothetical protein [Oscillospiraceae bacterium]
MNIPYRTRRRLNMIGTVALALFLVFIIVWFCWVIWIERYVVYTDDKATLDLNISANDIIGEVAVPPEAGGTGITIYYNEGANAIETSNELKALDGYFIDSDDLTNSLEGLWNKLKPLASGTPIMIDMKGGYGSFYYTSHLEDAILSQSVEVSKVDDLVSDMNAKGFYTIARISAFRDYNYGLNHVSNGLYMLSKAGLWADESGYYWLDPTNLSVQNWISSIINELKAMGFKEVVLTDFRFPTSEKYIFKGDKTAALVECAQKLAENTASDGFTLSFCVNDASFTLPEGRTRMYLENVDASSVGAKAAQASVEDTQVRLVFVAETNDTRYSDYSVLRPISVAEVMEAQKAEAAARQELSNTGNNDASAATAPEATAPTGAVG